MKTGGGVVGLGGGATPSYTMISVCEEQRGRRVRGLLPCTNNNKQVAFRIKRFAVVFAFLSGEITCHADPGRQTNTRKAEEQAEKMPSTLRMGAVCVSPTTRLSWSAVKPATTLNRGPTSMMLSHCESAWLLPETVTT